MADEAVAEYRQQGLTSTPGYGFALTILSGFQTDAEKFSEADANLAQAETILRKRLTSSDLWLGDNLRNQASSLYAQKRYTEALTKVTEALGIQQSFGVHYDNYPTALDVQGLTLAKTGRVDKGEKLLREALKLRLEMLPRDHFWVARAQGALGECLTLEKRYSEAAHLLTSSYESLQKTQGADNPRTKLARQRLVKFYQVTGQPELAARLSLAGSR